MEENIEKMYLSIEGAELMGDNLRDKLKYCGEDVKLYPLAKIGFPHVCEIGSHSKIRDFVFIFAGKGVKIGEWTDVQPHTIIWGGEKPLLAIESQQALEQYSFPKLTRMLPA